MGIIYEVLNFNRSLLNLDRFFPFIGRNHDSSGKWPYPPACPIASGQKFHHLILRFCKGLPDCPSTRARVLLFHLFQHVATLSRLRIRGVHISSSIPKVKTSSELYSTMCLCKITREISNLSSRGGDLWAFHEMPS